jgi:ribosomal protein L21E
MNSRTCKRLRGLARARSVGMPERRLLGRTVTVNKGTQRAYQTLIAVNDPKSTRGIYLAFKRELRLLGESHG